MKTSATRTSARKARMPSCNPAHPSAPLRKAERHRNCQCQQRDTKSSQHVGVPFCNQTYPDFTPCPKDKLGRSRVGSAGVSPTLAKIKVATTQESNQGKPTADSGEPRTELLLPQNPLHQLRAQNRDLLPRRQMLERKRVGGHFIAAHNEEVSRPNSVGRFKRFFQAK